MLQDIQRALPLSRSGGAPLHIPDPYYSDCVETCAGVYHYCKIVIDANQLYFEAVEPNGVVIDSFTLTHD